MKALLANQDCIEFMKNLKENSVDFVLTDPPYGTTACKWDSVIPLDPMWKQLKRIVKNDGAILVFGTEPFSSNLRISNIRKFKYDWVWDKVTARGHLVAKKRPLQQTEIISVFQNSKAPKYYPQMIDRPPEKVEIRKTTEYNKTTIMGYKQDSKAPTNVVYDKWYPTNLIRFSNAASSIKNCILLKNQLLYLNI